MRRTRRDSYYREAPMQNHSIARGCIISFQRWLNTVSSLLLSLFPGARREARGRAREHAEAWRAWLKGATGTFNALLEQEGLMAGEGPDSPGAEASEAYERARGRRRRWIRRWLRRAAPAPRRAPPATRPDSRHPASLAQGSALFDLPSGYAVASMIPRRGFLEDLWVQTEAGLGALFAAVRSALRRLLGGQTGASLARRAGAGGRAVLRRDSGSGALFSPLPTGGFLRRWEDSHVWTASDFVLRAGYPLEEHTVKTADGYVLAMQRIPRAGPAAGVVLFVHGVLDTSLGWVANGAVGSQAFAAYDAGYDVWLGNSRSNAPRLNLRPDKQGARYWRYSANELALLDIGAQVEHMHAVKVAEAQRAQRERRRKAAERDAGKAPNNASATDEAEGPVPEQPYRLQAVGHSLGAACLLAYATVCCMEGRPHRLSRLIIMSPAGFHTNHVPLFARFIRYLLPLGASFMDRFLPGRGIGLRLPSPFLRYVTFKLSLDISTLPALQVLVRRVMRAMLSGDVSEWDLAMQMPHYNTVSMPALSLCTGAQFQQWSRDGAFRLYDYGSARRNLAAYGTAKPPSIAHNYRLLNIPVDLVAGTLDRVVTPADVKMHAHWLSRSPAGVTFKEFLVGHMDLTFAVKPELREYVLRRLQRPLPPPPPVAAPDDGGAPAGLSYIQRCAEATAYAF
ncbi:hypothetical protein QBZ16_000731 [Prototheca wickerhamii]|uniref:Partial AB-hydrolase lipase domain-containing protein n=1 Tax=Prototheca wickerhamii TaxID=3111 RepID=A0AAD9IQ47_PROWI|nr:hypothetical protein QBZ16_000731 [Prototheca wickerhamii]